MQYVQYVLPWDNYNVANISEILLKLFELQLINKTTIQIPVWSLPPMSVLQFSMHYK